MKVQNTIRNTAFPAMAWTAAQPGPAAPKGGRSVNRKESRKLYCNFNAKNCQFCDASQKKQDRGLARRRPEILTGQNAASGAEIALNPPPGAKKRTYWHSFCIVTCLQ